MVARAALYLATRNNWDLIADATHYVYNIRNNDLFTAADFVQLATFTETAAQTLSGVLNSPISDSKKLDIIAKRDVLEKYLILLANKVENLANDPTVPDDQREPIIASAGMQVRGKGAGKKRLFTVENDDVDGTVILTAPAVGIAHEWQYTADASNLTGRISVDPTTASTVKIEALTLGTRYAFFHRPILTGVKANWEGPLFLIVS